MGMEGREVYWLVALCSWDLGVFSVDSQLIFLENRVGFLSLQPPSPETP